MFVLAGVSEIGDGGKMVMGWGLVIGLGDEGVGGRMMGGVSSLVGHVHQRRRNWGDGFILYSSGS